MTGSKRSLPGKIVIGSAIACMALAALPAPSRAEVRRVSVSSNPEGASVYMMKGFKREAVGVTPVEHVFDVQSERSILRLMVEKSGYRSRVVKVDSAGAISIDLDEVEVIEQDAANAGFVIERGRLLEAVAPWSIDAPAAVKQVDEYQVVTLTLVSADQRPSPDKSLEVAGRLASQLAHTGTALDGVLLVFKWQAVQGVSTSLTTRTKTEMACEGAMVPTSVWDSCATRSATTSTTSTGVKTEYRCVGGTVTRPVWNSCARRVPRQKQVVALQADVDGALRDNALIQVLEADADRFRPAGHCVFRNGRRVDAAGAQTSSLVAAACAQ